MVLLNNNNNNNTMHNSTSNNDKDLTLLLGKKLLMGWTMLDNVCKVCKIVPLVEDKKNNVILCCSCDRVLKRDSNQNIVEDTNAAAATTTIKQPTNDITIPNNSSNNSSRNSTPQPITSSNTVEMKEKYNNYEDFDYEEYDDTPLTEEEKISIEKRMKKSDEFSSKMGEFLLKGWTLLGDVCPNYDCFGVPLMKDREKKYYCVSCKMTGLELDDLVIKPTATSTTTTSSSSSSNNNNNKQIQPITPITSTPVKLINNTTTTASSSPSYPIEPDQKKQRMAGTTPQKEICNNNSSFVSTLSTTATTSSSLLNEDIQELPNFTDSTLSILFDKLKDAQQQFLSTNNIEYCLLIREYSSTISSLLDLKKHWTIKRN